LLSGRLKLLWVLFTVLVLSSVGIYQADAKEYVILQEKSSLYRQESTRNLIESAGLDALKMTKVFSGLRGGRIELGDKDRDLLSAEYPGMVIIPADIVLYPSPALVEGTVSPASGTPWHVLLAEDLVDRVNNENGDFDGQRVFVLDTGVDEDHPGLVDCLDLSFARNFSGGGSFDIDDDNGHGTEVAGVIAGSTTGVSPSTRVVPLKVAGAYGLLTTGDLAAAIDYVITLKEGSLSGENIVVNLSYNSRASRSPDSDLYDYFQVLLSDLYTAGVLFISSAGNDGSDVDELYVYPTENESAIYLSTGAVKSDGTLAYYSNYGVTTVEVAAPGSSIETTGPGGSYTSVSGTSFASPFAAGIASMIWALDPSLAAWEVRNLLIHAVKGVEIEEDFLQEYTGYEDQYLFMAGNSFLRDSAYGDGLLDVIAGKTLYPSTIANNPVDPGKAYDPSPANGQGHLPLEIDLSWEIPSLSGSFDVYLGTDQGVLELLSQGISSPPLALSDLEPERTYFWRVDTHYDGEITSGDLWAFSTVILEAYDPFPVDSAINVDSSDVTLSWDSDIDGATFDVYLSTSSADIVGSDPSVLVAQNLMVPSFHVSAFEEDTTYYWAVMSTYDGVPGIDNTTRISEIWSFTTGEDPGLIPSGGGGGGCELGVLTPAFVLLLLPLLFMIGK